MKGDLTANVEKWEKFIRKLNPIETTYQDMEKKITLHGRERH